MFKGTSASTPLLTNPAFKGWARDAAEVSCAELQYGRSINGSLPPEKTTKRIDTEKAGERLSTCEQLLCTA